MESHMLPAGARGVCPRCGADDRLLFLCQRCDWKGAPEAARADAKQRLHEFRTGAGFLAFNPRGCQICETCWTQMGASVLACPLRLFYEAGLAPEERTLPSDRRFGNAVCRQWERWLADRDWPEPTEIHWRRMVDHMVGEREEA
jgi:hypothetical protein